MTNKYLKHENNKKIVEIEFFYIKSVIFIFSCIYLVIWSFHIVLGVPSVSDIIIVICFMVVLFMNNNNYNNNNLQFYAQ